MMFHEKDSVIKNIPADERCKNGRQSNQTSDPKEQVFQNGNDTKKTVIAGFGPAGMFAALELARAGKQPVVLERGLEVEKRQDKVDAFWKGKGLDPECIYFILSFFNFKTSFQNNRLLSGSCKF